MEAEPGTVGPGSPRDAEARRENDVRALGAHHDRLRRVQLQVEPRVGDVARHIDRPVQHPIRRGTLHRRRGGPLLFFLAVGPRRVGRPRGRRLDTLVTGVVRRPGLLTRIVIRMPTTGMTIPMTHQAQRGCWGPCGGGVCGGPYGCPCGGPAGRCSPSSCSPPWFPFVCASPWPKLLAAPQKNPALSPTTPHSQQT